MVLDRVSRVGDSATKLVRIGICRRCARSRYVEDFWDNGGVVFCRVLKLYTGIKARRGMHRVKRERIAHVTHMALATSPRRKVISISADMLLNFELSPGCLNSAKSFGKSASTSVAAIDAGRPCKTLTRLRMKRSAKVHTKKICSRPRILCLTARPYMPSTIVCSSSQ